MYYGMETSSFETLPKRVAGDKTKHQLKRNFFAGIFKSKNKKT
ncbi:DUF2805 domain-containing protein [cyanobacterium endosymbiont of Rhopalodia gibberula]